MNPNQLSKRDDITESTASSHKTEDDDLCNCARPKSLREVSRVSHLSNETGQSDLADEGIADVEKGGHSVDECRALDRDGGDDGLAQLCRVISKRVILDAGEDGSKEDGNEGKNGRGCSELGHHVEGPRQGADPTDEGNNNGEHDSSAATNIIGGSHGVEDEAYSSCPPSPLLAPEQHLPNIADIAHFRMAQAKLPEHKTGVKNDKSNNDCQDNTRNQTENTVRPRETHDGETDVLTEEQTSSLLP
ncbi:hypothetical protein HG530_007609 [Fusarium avenaceum]|nr:hypothetical protein HG530_007609 [Fusarium avenaceum]